MPKKRKPERGEPPGPLSCDRLRCKHADQFSEQTVTERVLHTNGPTNIRLLPRKFNRQLESVRVLAQTRRVKASLLLGPKWPMCRNMKPASQIEIRERRNNEMLMHDVFVDGQKIGHYYVVAGVSVWAAKNDREKTVRRFSDIDSAIDWITS